MVYLINISILLISVIIHEVAHGWIANRLGDPTAKQLGRLSFNPLVHVDILGSLILPALFVISGSSFLIGWAKPVPINPRHFRNPSKDMMLVAIAGPLSNLSIAWLSRIILIIYNPAPLSVFTYILKTTIVINLILMIFNLIPIPPLDGSRVLCHLLPSHLSYRLSQLEPYGFVIIFLMAYFNLLYPIISFFFTPLASLFL